MAKILVTGAAGFIGSHLVQRLLFQGHSVIGIDNFDPFYSRSIKTENMEEIVNTTKFQFCEMDIMNKKMLMKLFSENKIEIVVHLAAKAGVRPSLLDPEGYYETNVIGTLNLLEVMREYGCKKLIFASSSSIYGNSRKIPFSEGDKVDNPISPYAATKKAAELLCYTYHHLYNFDIFCLRFFTVYGPRQRPDLAIHKFINNIYRGKSIIMYGDGTTKRDYTYIDDILDGIIKSIENLKGYEIFNLGESQTISLIDLIRKIENLVGKNALLEQLPEQPGDVRLTKANIAKARNILGYSPKVDINDGLSKFVEWYFERENKYENINCEL